MTAEQFTEMVERVAATTGIDVETMFGMTAAEFVKHRDDMDKEDAEYDERV